MSESHWTEQEQWLAKQGVRIKGVRSLHSIHHDPFSLHQYHNDDTLTAMQTLARTWEEPAYTVEVTGSTVKRWQAMEKRMQYVAGIANTKNSPWEDPDAWIEAWRKHQQLLVSNPMYKEAWTEFLSIRAILGEDTSWP